MLGDCGLAGGVCEGPLGAGLLGAVVGGAL